MAKQSGHILVTGTINGVTYYKMYGNYYARMKSSLSRKKVLTNPRFARTRMHANQLVEASKIASQLYRNIPKEERDVKIFRSFVGKAKVLLAEGNDKETVLEILMNELFFKAKIDEPKQIIQKKPKQKIQKGIQDRAYVTKKGRLIWKEINPSNSSKETLMTSGIWQLPIMSENNAVRLE